VCYHLAAAFCLQEQAFPSFLQAVQLQQVLLRVLQACPCLCELLQYVYHAMLLLMLARWLLHVLLLQPLACLCYFDCPCGFDRVLQALLQLAASQQHQLLLQWGS
jgi:hypothetical protein